MIRKLSAILLIMMVLVSTVGVTVHKHYCASFLVDTSFIPHIEDACDEDMPMEEGSCRDHHEVYKLDSPIQILSINFELSPSIEWLIVSYFNLQIQDGNQFSKPILLAELYPPPTEPNIYTRVQSFLL
jgi:hypothetical protein